MNRQTLFSGCRFPAAFHMVRPQVRLTIILLGTLVGCRDKVQDAPVQPAAVTLRPRPDWQLVPESEALKLEVVPGALKGKLSSTDKEQILALAGRVKGISKKIHRFETCWDDYTVAAHLSFALHEIYCVKDDSNHWIISRVLFWWP